MPSAIKWQAAAASDTGLVRTRNEDRYWIDEERGIFLVVDGVGGHAAGETAAQTAVDAIRAQLATAGGTPEERIRRAIALANNRIFELASSHAEWRGMACVLTLALAGGDAVTVGHVGDSRLYLIWNGAIRKLTPDHSPVGEREDAGELTEEEAMFHPRRNEVFRDVGSARREAGDEGFIEIRRFQLKPDAAFLICSDGLTDQLTAAGIREIIDSYEGDAARVAADLVKAANAAGGKDNTTALLVAGREFLGRRSRDTAEFRAPAFAALRDEAPRRGLLTGRMAFLIYGLLLGMLVWAVWRGVRG
jgi:PPM family protein phosphatase